jgi:predicted nucleic acid-binding protein
MAMTFVDTNILIEYLKGNREKIDSLGFNHICVSDIVLMELYQGAKNKQDFAFIKQTLQDIYIVATDNDIITLAKEILQRYNLSHNAKIYDAIIAATVLIYDLDFLTLNKKDFKYIPNIKLL